MYCSVVDAWVTRTATAFVAVRVDFFYALVAEVALVCPSKTRATIYLIVAFGADKVFLRAKHGDALEVQNRQKRFKKRFCLF